MQSERSSRLRGWLLLGVLALAFGLRLVRLADAAIWWDEGLAVWAARQSLFDIARWTAADVHPPLYFWMLHGWRQLVGDSEFAVRFLSASVGTLTVVALWRLGRWLLPGARWLPLVAALLLTTSRFAIWWSQEARMYALGALWATLSLALTVRLRWRPSRAAVVGYVTATVAALWTLYLLAFLLVIEGLYWLWTLRALPDGRTRGASLGRWAMLQAGVLVAFVPWLLYALPRMRAWSAQAPFEPRLYLDLYATLLTLGTSTHVERYASLVWVLIALVALGLVAGVVRGQSPGGRESPPRARRDGLVLLLLALLVPPAVVWGVTTLPRAFGYLPKPEARYLLPFAPAFALLVARAGAGWAAWAGRARAVVGVGLMVGWLGLAGWSVGDYYASRYRLDDYPSVVATLRAHHRPADAVVLHTDEPWPVFAYHWPGVWVGTPHLQAADAGGAAYFLSPVWDAHDALWLVVNEDALRVDPQRRFEAWLRDRAVATHEWRFGPTRLLLFARTPERAATLQALAPSATPPVPLAGLADDLPALVGWEQPLTRLRAGETAHLAATVQAAATPQTLEVWLEGLPEARATATVPAGEGPRRVTLHVPVPPDVGNRAARWRVRLGGQEATLGAVRLVASAPRAAPAAPVTPTNELAATFGSPPLARLLGYDVAPSPLPEPHLRVTLFWQVEAPASLPYKVFVHLLDERGQVATQRDDVPVGGMRPTTGWRAGERLVDAYDVPLAGTPAGAYTLVIGFYDPVTGERLPVRRATGQPDSPQDQLRLDTLTLPVGEAVSR